MVFQNSMSALNPVMRIGDQIADALQEHVQMSRKEALEQAAAAFGRVGLPDSRLMQYPHEFSGGMKQRAMIALALICQPRLLIADEPTTALDMVAQRQVLQLLDDLQRELDLALLLISHDISVVAETCSQVVVMYAGEIVELGPTKKVLHYCRHPYTRALVSSVPSLYAPARTLTSLPGAPPSLIDPPPGCRFAPRCTFAQLLCSAEVPPVVTVESAHVARCHFALDLDFDAQAGEYNHAAG
jgi:oligopeptide/dipeptide ABC transporter ATP-binding protein